MTQQATQYVIDTSSLLCLRRELSSEGNPELGRIYRALGSLVQRDLLYFPRQVFDELDRQHEEIMRSHSRQLDLPHRFAEQHRERANGKVSEEDLFREARFVLSHAPRLIDPNLTGREAADPYVVGMALHLKQLLNQVVVVTDDARDTRTKTSVRTAAGLVGLPAISVFSLLDVHKIWPRQY